MPVKYIYIPLDFLNRFLLRLSREEVEPYSMAYDLMSSHSASCTDAKQMYMNGHFCYADKFAIPTNDRMKINPLVTLSLWLLSFPTFFPTSRLPSGHFPR